MIRYFIKITANINDNTYEYYKGKGGKITRSIPRFEEQGYKNRNIALKEMAKIAEANKGRQVELFYMDF